MKICDNLSLESRKCRSWMDMKKRKIELHLTSSDSCMKQEAIDINNPNIEGGWESFVFKKRSQRNQKKRHRKCRK